jgi:hypothetical protein
MTQLPRFLARAASTPEAAALDRALAHLDAASPEAVSALEPLDPLARLVATLELGRRGPPEPVATALLRAVMHDFERGDLKVSSDVFSPVASVFTAEGLTGLARHGDISAVISLAKALWRSRALTDVARRLVDAGDLDQARALRDATTLKWRQGTFAPLHMLVTMSLGEPDANKRLGAIARGAGYFTPEVFACMVTGDGSVLPLDPSHRAIEALFKKLLRTKSMQDEAVRVIELIRTIPLESADWLERARALADALTERESKHAGAAWLDVAGLAARTGQRAIGAAAIKKLRQVATSGLGTYAGALLVSAIARNVDVVPRRVLLDLARGRVGLQRVQLARALGEDSLLEGRGPLVCAALGDLDRLSRAPLDGIQAREVLVVLVEQGEIPAALELAAQHGLHLSGHAIRHAEPPMSPEQLELILDDALRRGEVPHDSTALSSMVEGVIAALRRRGAATLVQEAVEVADRVADRSSRIRCLTDAATLEGAPRLAVVRLALCDSAAAT